MNQKTGQINRPSIQTKQCTRLTVAEFCRQNGIAESTYYRCRERYEPERIKQDARSEELFFELSGTAESVSTKVLRVKTDRWELELRNCGDIASLGTLVRELNR